MTYLSNGRRQTDGAMSPWFLVLILSMPGDETAETHVAINMPDEQTCDAMRENFAYALHLEDAGDQGTPLKIRQELCVKGNAAVPQEQ